MTCQVWTVHSIALQSRRRHNLHEVMDKLEKGISLNSEMFKDLKTLEYLGLGDVISNDRIMEVRSTEWQRANLMMGMQIRFCR